MATAQTLIDRSGGILGIVSAPGAAVDATTSAAMLTVLQDLVSELGEKGGLEIAQPSALGDTLNVSPGSIRALAYNLAVDYSNNIGKQISATVMTTAADTRAWLIGRATVSREINLGADGLTVQGGRYNVNTDG